MTDSKYAASLIESCARVTVCFSKYCIALSLCPNRLAGFVLIILHDLWLRRVPCPDSSSHLSAICNQGDLTAWISKGVSTGLLNTGYMIHWLLPKGKSSLSLSYFLCTIWLVLYVLTPHSNTIETAGCGRLLLLHATQTNYTQAPTHS